MHQQEPFNIEAAIIAVTIVFLILGSFLVMITVVYRKRRNTQLVENIKLKSAFRQELLKTQNEIQEQTLTHISREIHDNITQVLSFVKLNLAMAGNLTSAQQAQKIEESRKLVAQVISDLRDLSKSMSFEHIAQLGLIKTIEIETDRMNNSGIINTAFETAGDAYSLGDQRELVLFRIFQEAVNNTLKHSGADHLKISLQYSDDLFNLTIADNGAGFNITGIKDGAGLKNIHNRAALVKATTKIISEPGKGCSITICIIDPLLQQEYANGDQNSTG